MIPTLKGVYPALAQLEEVHLTVASLELWSDRVIVRFAIASGEDASAEEKMRSHGMAGYRMSLIDDLGTEYSGGAWGYSGGDPLMLGATTFRPEVPPDATRIELTVGIPQTGASASCEVRLK